VAPLGPVAVACWYGFTAFTIIDTWQLEVGLSKEVPKTIRSLPIGTCSSLVGDVIFTACDFGDDNWVFGGSSFDICACEVLV
jgi:hypothetical protein